MINKSINYFRRTQKKKLKKQTEILLEIIFSKVMTCYSFKIYENNTFFDLFCMKFTIVCIDMSVLKCTSTDIVYYITLVPCIGSFNAQCNHFLKNIYLISYSNSKQPDDSFYAFAVLSNDILALNLHLCQKRQSEYCNIIIYGIKKKRLCIPLFLSFS